MSTDYYSQRDAMSNAQFVYDSTEAPEYYEDDDYPTPAECKRLLREFNAQRPKDKS
jgi:hypothetical protein